MKSNLLLADSFPKATNNFSSICNKIYFMFIKLLFFLRYPFTRQKISKLIGQFKHDLTDMRPLFRINEIPVIRASIFHTHPQSAAERTSASDKLVSVIKQAGYNPYMVSMASADQRESLRGCRYYYWPKDLKASYQDDAIQADDVLVFIDVDFHCDMKEYLKLARPIIMYTLTPETVTGKHDEFNYVIKNNVINYRVTGGAVYKHEIWDYDGECLAQDDGNGNTIFYHIEQRIVDGLNGRRIITLLPFTIIPTFLTRFLNPQYLNRKRYTNNGINTIYDSINDNLSVGLNGSFQSVEMKGRTFEALKQRLMAKLKAPFTIGDVEQYMYDDYEKTVKVKIEAALLYSVFQQTLDIRIIPNVLKTSQVNTSYTPIGPLTCQEPKEPCKILTTPVVTTPAVFPTQGLNSEVAAITGRIEAVSNKTVPDRKFKRFADEFIELLVPKSSIGFPMTIDEVMEIQNKPLQRARTNMVAHLLGVGAKNRLKTFNKAEAYLTPSDPRIITTCDPKLTLEMSRFTYAFKRDVLKQFHWYGPGKTPSEAVNCLRTIARDGVIETDYSRFDGSISEWLQKSIVFAAYNKWVNANEKVLMNDYLTQVFIKRGRTSSGLKYHPGWGTRSGSPITTDGNTMINAFLTYASIRMIGYHKNDAFKRLGIYAGDDGVTASIPSLPVKLEHVCSRLGLGLKVKVIDRNLPFTYLGRIFPSILTHDDSFQDPKRTLPKMHLTANKNVSREQAATNKAIGYLVTDSYTPIISNYSEKVLQLTGLNGKNFHNEELYKIENGAWPQQDHALIQDAFCKHMNLSSVELAERIALIDQVSTLDEFPLLFNTTEEPKIDAIVGDNLQTRPRDTKPQGNGKSTKQSRRFERDSRQPGECPTRDIRGYVDPRTTRPRPSRRSTDRKDARVLPSSRHSETSNAGSGPQLRRTRDNRRSTQ